MRKDNPYYPGRGRPDWRALQWENKMSNLGEFIDTTTQTATIGKTNYDCEVRKHEKGYELIYGVHFKIVLPKNNQCQS